jgi:hypothetical protein
MEGGGQKTNVKNHLYGLNWGDRHLGLKTHTFVHPSIIYLDR